MAKKQVAKKPASAKNSKLVSAAAKPKKASALKPAAKTSVATPQPRANATTAHGLFAFTYQVGPSDDGDRIVELAYPDELQGEVLALFFQPAREADSIPDDWTEQHAVQLLRFSREPNGSATARIHRIDHGWNGRGWAANLLLHVMVATR